MRNTFLDIYDYIKINQKIRELEEEKTYVDNKLLRYIKSRKKTDTAKYIKERTIALKDSTEINDELNDARRNADFLSTCIRHPIITRNLEFDPEEDYDALIEDYHTKNKRYGILDYVPETYDYDDTDEEYVDNRILFTIK